MNQQFFKRSMLVLGVFTAVAAGQVAPAESEEQAATKASLTGQQVYKTVCIACHAPPGVGGAPALGNADAWAGRITQGMETLSDHALNGFSGNTGVMPKKGERPDLSDEEIIKAVKYMVEQAAQ